MAEMLELTPAPEIFCSGLGKIEKLEGDNLRLWLYASEKPLEGGEAARIVAVRVVIPASAIVGMIRQMIAAGAVEEPFAAHGAISAHH